MAFERVVVVEDLRQRENDQSRSRQFFLSLSLGFISTIFLSLLRAVYRSGRHNHRARFDCFPYPPPQTRNTTRRFYIFFQIAIDAGFKGTPALVSRLGFNFASSTFERFRRRKTQHREKRPLNCRRDGYGTVVYTNSGLHKYLRRIILLGSVTEPPTQLPDSAASARIFVSR